MKLLNLLKIIYKLITYKESKFRNILLNFPDEFFNFNEDFVKDVKNNIFQDQPFNGQVIRRKIIFEFLTMFKFDKIIETGTYLGNTTIFLSKFKTPVESVEINPDYFQIAKIRFKNFNNVQIVLSDSVDYLSSLDFNKKYFIYLDAHWYEKLPLKKELEILSSIKNVTILIDDFKVENDSSWKYDVYNNIELSINNFNEELKAYDIFFPNYDARLDKNNNRGFVILTNEPEHKNFFCNNRYLLQFND